MSLTHDQHLKTCINCKEQKNISDFGINRAMSDGLNKKCKKCHNLYNRQFKKKKTIERRNKVLCEHQKNESSLLIPNYPNYSIDRNGIIRNLKTGITLKGYMSNGQRVVSLKNDMRRQKFNVHKLKVEVFNLTDDSKVDYEGNKTGNLFKNLKWIKEDL